MMRLQGSTAARAATVAIWRNGQHRPGREGQPLGFLGLRQQHYSHGHKIRVSRYLSFLNIAMRTLERDRQNLSENITIFLNRTDRFPPRELLAERIQVSCWNWIYFCWFARLFEIPTWHDWFADYLCARFAPPYKMALFIKSYFFNKVQVIRLQDLFGNNFRYNPAAKQDIFPNDLGGYEIGESINFCLL